MGDRQTNAVDGERTRVYINNEPAQRQETTREVPHRFASFLAPDNWNQFRLEEPTTRIFDVGSWRRYETTYRPERSSSWFVKLFSESFGPWERVLFSPGTERTILRLDDNQRRPDLVGVDAGYRTRWGLEISMGPRLLFHGNHLSPGAGVTVGFSF